jgi:hypothetical protein
MRFLVLAVGVAVTPAFLAAQTGPASGWSVTLAAEAMRFGRIGVQDEDAVAQAELRPSGRGGFRVTLERLFGAWRAQVEAGWAAGDTEVTNEFVAIRDKQLDMSRFRLAPAVERRVSAVGPGELAIALAPSLDFWQADGNSRTRLGVEGRLAVRVPLGRLALENRVAFGISGAPVDQEDVGDLFELRALRSVTFGVGVRVPL